MWQEWDCGISTQKLPIITDAGLDHLFRQMGNEGNMKKALAILAVAAMGIVASQVSAATLTFGSYATTTDNTGAFPTPLVTVNDDTAGLISFSISSSGASGNLSGAFFDISGVMLSVGDILNESVSLAGFGTSTGNVGGGVVMNGTYSDPSATNNPTFDFGLRIAQTNVSSTPFTFQISSACTDGYRAGRTAISDCLRCERYAKQCESYRHARGSFGSANSSCRTDAADGTRGPGLRASP